MVTIEHKQAKRCEKYFINALLELMRKKPFQEITIKELSSHAEYDRKTFYRHFSCKEDILKIYCSYILDEMAVLQTKMGSLTFRSGILSYYVFWEKHIDFLFLLEKNNLLYFLGEHQDNLIYDNVGKKVQPEIPDSIDIASDFSKYSVYFMYGGLWRVLIYWIKEPQRKTPEEITDFILELFNSSRDFMS